MSAAGYWVNHRQRMLPPDGRALVFELLESVEKRLLTEVKVYVGPCKLREASERVGHALRD